MTLSESAAAVPARDRRSGRARLPDAEGWAVRDGVKLAWSSYGSGPATILLLPTWSIVDSRVWKAQVGYLARHVRVITFDGRGCGLSDVPRDPADYVDEQFAADAVAVLDAAGVRRAVVVGFSSGGSWAVHLAAGWPERVAGLVAIAPSCLFDDSAHPERSRSWWEEDPEHPTGWQTYSRAFWQRGGFTEFVPYFFGQLFCEPHSTKQIEDGIGWALDTGWEATAASRDGRVGARGAVRTPIEPLCARVRCPVLVIHGTDDRIVPFEVGARLAELTGGELLRLDGVGHGPQARHPVLVNTELRRFTERIWPPTVERSWRRALGRPTRVLYLSSPIGLGHARRDLAVADELRRLRPDVAVDWLAQHPVTRVLADRGEAVHPASRWLANESAHIEAESLDHDLHAFGALRRMDEILINNFMVFDDVVADGEYDLVVGDEAWDVDYFLHENPDRKRFAYAWFTDFVGWLPMPDGGAAEAALTADYNAEMIEQRARFRRLRDRSLFVGQPADIVPDAFGPGLPAIRDWTRANFDFTGYITDRGPVGPDERAALRAKHGYADDERVCLVSVGGSGVGDALLRRVLAAVPLARRRAPELRFVIVAGPRIDPAGLPTPTGATVTGYLPDLDEHIVACDLAVVQGGLSTCMELTAAARPFLYVPLRHHFEQNFHVRSRLDRYHAGTRIDYDLACDPDALVAAMLDRLDRPVAYRPVETDGAARAAAYLVDLL
ncbi:alpha/beta hydrolase [Microlunatus ginsengisoli]|uniref:Pimeloyl-ACP methyl ester carboxylesterase n=1 Tax=Microlunatus ginsengisoli TaxID=363863 RepID=A0ABP6ZU75_9ACTN